MPYDVKTEPYIDWLCGTGFEGRAVLPINRTCPIGGGTGGGGGAPAAPTGTPPTADFTISPPAGTDYVWGETVTITGGWTMPGTTTPGLSNDTDGVIVTQEYKVLSTGVTEAKGSSSSHSFEMVLGPGVAGTPTGNEFIKLTVTDDGGNSANKIETLSVVQADLVEPTSLSAGTAFYNSSGDPVLTPPIFSQVQPIFNVTGFPDEYGSPYFTV